MTLVLRYAVRSDVGLLREGNEDSAYAGPSLLAVADGMGGHAAGEVASSLTIASMSEIDTRPPDDDMLEELSQAVATANTRLQDMIIANPAVEGMGTTLTALFWSDGHAAVCHIGDSRGYLLREGELYQITHDHTLVQSLVDEGRITAADVATHPQRSLLLRALDGRSIAEPDLSVHDGQAGDRNLLCSDGLSGVVSDETLRDTLATIADPEAVTRQLIELALHGGGPDNITCIVADVLDTETTRLPSAQTPVLAGAAANAGDPRFAPGGTGPFAAVEDPFTEFDEHEPPSLSVPHQALGDDDLGLGAMPLSAGAAEPPGSAEASHPDDPPPLADRDDLTGGAACRHHRRCLRSLAVDAGPVLRGGRQQGQRRYLPRHHRAHRRDQPVQDLCPDRDPAEPGPVERRADDQGHHHREQPAGSPAHRG
jgi:serine/threonine protein phosphatase PrpC